METLVVLTATVNRLVETVKRLLANRSELSESNRQLLTFAAQLIIGVGTAFVAQTQFDVLAGTPFAKMGPLFGTVFAGLALSLGAEFIHFIEDLTKGLTPTTTSATLTVTGNSNTAPQATASVSVGGEVEAKG